jgi:hypothetical protein
MAWNKAEIVVSGETVNGQMNMSNDRVEIEIPFVQGVEIGSSITADGKDFKIDTIVNVGDRDETLTLGANNEQISRRAKNKSK